MLRAYRAIFMGEPERTLEQRCPISPARLRMPDRASRRGCALVGFFPQTFVRLVCARPSTLASREANDDPRAHLSKSRFSSSGLFVLLVEAFCETDRQAHVSPHGDPRPRRRARRELLRRRRRRRAAATGFWSFYTADPLAIFFKRFALVTTILVLVMMIDYAPASCASRSPARRRKPGSANFSRCRSSPAPG